MIENSNFYSGLKRAAGGEIAVALVNVNGLMRTAGKLFLQVMAVGTGPLSNRMDINVSNKVGFCQFRWHRRDFSVFVLFFDRGQRRFFISGGFYHETMAHFKIIFAEKQIYFERKQLQ